MNCFLGSSFEESLLRFNSEWLNWTRENIVKAAISCICIKNLNVGMMSTVKTNQFHGAKTASWN